MNRQDRVKLLSQSLSEAASAAEQELTDKQKVERIAPAVRAKLTAETSKEYPQCPHCGGVLEGWPPDGNTLTFVETDPGTIVSGFATRGR